MCMSPRRCIKEAFCDLESLEQGEAREFIAEELLAPSPSAGDGWLECRLVRPTKTRYALYGPKGFLLSAEKVGESLYVSAYEFDTPRENGERRRAAILTPSRGRGLRYRLHLCVGALVVADAAPLVDVVPTTHRIGNSDVDVRGYAVRCSPAAAGPHYTRDVAKLVAGAPDAENHPSTAGLKLRSRLPAWDKRNGCMSLKFGRGRVRRSSSKNVLIYAEDALRGSPSPDAALFQMGKTAKGEFAVDFRAPLAPIHAFAIALAAFDSKYALRRGR